MPPLLLLIPLLVSAPFVLLVLAVLIFKKRTQPQEFTLPNGLRVHASNEFECNLLYHEIFEEEAYLKHGVSLDPDKDQVVFDVGANMGFWSMFLASQGRFFRLRIHAFEPMPETFAILAKNKANIDVNGNQVFMYQMGMSDKPGRAEFLCEPGNTVGTGMAGDKHGMHSLAHVEGVGLGTYDTILRGMLLDGNRVHKISDGALSVWMAVLGVPVLGKALGIALGAYASLLIKLQRWRSGYMVSCKITTVSEVMRSQGIGRVDLLKVDVEGCEEDVLRGVEEQDWPKIRQVVAEVHDIDGRLDRLTQMLERRGMKVTTEQEDWALHKLWKIHSIFAHR